jgi:membrane-associated phospholipid phosphatase
VTFTRPGPSQFRDQLQYVNSYADLRGDRVNEVFAELGISEAFFGSITEMRQERTPRSFELAVAAVRLAYYVVMRVKHGLACRRPHEYSPQIQPMLPVPTHATWPSGHATEAFTFAYVLSELLRASDNPIYKGRVWKEEIMRLAGRIAANRTVAGVHFPVDSAAGATLGLTLGRYFLARCNKGAGYTAWKFDGTKFAGDFDWRDIAHTLEGTSADPSKAPRYLERMEKLDLSAKDYSPPLSWLWSEARKEWAMQPSA